MMHYLSKKSWSHRYEKHFFTVKMDYPSISYETTLPPSYKIIESDDVKCGCHCSSTIKSKLPAYYYIIEVCVGGTTDQPLKVYRRYSEFIWLYNKLKSNPPPPLSLLSTEENTNNINIPTLPPKTLFWKKQISDEFRNERQTQLYNFLDDILSRPGYSTHPAMKSFLLLDSIYNNNEEENTSDDDYHIDNIKRIM